MIWATRRAALSAVAVLVVAGAVAGAGMVVGQRGEDVSSNDGETEVSPDNSDAEVSPDNRGPQSFRADFSGNTGLEAFRLGVFHRDVDVLDSDHQLDGAGERTWLGDHDVDCGGADTKRELDKANRSDSIYMCRDHLMTSVGDVDSYSVVWFSPDRTFDAISEVCWDVNVSSDLLGGRQWWEVAVVPVGSPDVFADSGIAGTANVNSYGEVGATVVAFTGIPQYLKVSVGDEVVGEESADIDGFRDDLMTRVPHCLADSGDGTMRVTTVNDDGSPFMFEVPGSFPSGAVKVVFEDHSYTPDKDCGDAECASYTWHWDNIMIDGSPNIESSDGDASDEGAEEPREADTDAAEITERAPIATIAALRGGRDRVTQTVGW